MAKRVTLADVALLAGVSKTSASMALADSPRVAQQTKINVRRAVVKLGYVPHAGASALRSQRADSIAVVLPHAARHVFSHPIFIDLLEGISTVANELDLSVILSTARSALDESSAYARIVRGRAAAGVIVAAASVSDHNPVDVVAAAGVPVVVVGRLPDDQGVATVGVDDLGGASAAVRHLIQVHGARRIGHVSGPLDHQSSIDKRDAYVAVVEQAGLSVDSRLEYEGDYEEASGAQAARMLLPSLEPGDAVFFANDQMAIGALEEWRRGGLRVPEDVRVVSYDNHPMSRHATPALTTVDADMVAVGRSAVRQLARLFEGERDLPKVEFPTELVVRESCGCGAPRGV